MHKLAKLRCEGAGELAIGLQHQCVGIEAIKIPGVDTRHDLPHHGLVALIKRRNLYHLEPGGVGEMIGFFLLLGSGAKINQGSQLELFKTV